MEAMVATPMTMNDLTVNFRHLDRDSLLDEWIWLIGVNKKPVLITALGNAFLQEPADDSISLLEVGSGELRPIAASIAGFRSLLNDKEFVHHELAAGLVVTLRECGKLLKSGEVYSYKVPPRLGGVLGPENLHPCDLSVHFSILGQLHRQIEAAPAGSRVRVERIV